MSKEGISRSSRSLSESSSKTVTVSETVSANIAPETSTSLEGRRESGETQHQFETFDFEPSPVTSTFFDDPETITESPTSIISNSKTKWKKERKNTSRSESCFSVSSGSECAVDTFGKGKRAAEKANSEKDISLLESASSTVNDLDSRECLILDKSERASSNTGLVPVYKRVSNSKKTKKVKDRIDSGFDLLSGIQENLSDNAATSDTEGEGSRRRIKGEPYRVNFESSTANFGDAESAVSDHALEQAGENTGKKNKKKKHKKAKKNQKDRSELDRKMSVGLSELEVTAAVVKKKKKKKHQKDSSPSLNLRVLEDTTASDSPGKKKRKDKHLADSSPPATTSDSQAAATDASDIDMTFTVEIKKQEISATGSETILTVSLSPSFYRHPSLYQLAALSAMADSLPETVAVYLETDPEASSQYMTQDSSDEDTADDPVRMEVTFRGFCDIYVTSRHDGGRDSSGGRASDL